jgi:MoaA/NifB/PqqE/SkfB family radical SAM enzyme
MIQSDLEDGKSPVEPVKPVEALLEGSRAFCMAPSVNLTVAVGGAAAPCCEIKGGVGDSRRQLFEEIWRSDAFDTLRRARTNFSGVGCEQIRRLASGNRIYGYLQLQRKADLHHASR